MDFVRVFKAFAVGLSSLGLILPTPIVNAGPPAARTARLVESQSRSTSDVRLDAAGYLNGMVVDSQNRPVANAMVVLSRGKRDLLEIRTDPRGRFSAGPLDSGIYLMRSGGKSSPIRTWTPKMAPPAAGQMALLVTSSPVIRGQMPLEDFFASDAFVITGLVAAMIAIPIALNNSGSKTPASP